LAAPETGIGFGEVRIARSVAARKTEPLLNEAYAAYVAGDYATARRLYEAVLAESPERRDALLGLAALHLRDGEVTSAHRMYQQVLKRDPDNPTAVAALFTIEGGAGNEMTESRLKLLLDEGVDVGYVYFSLGNLYASNARWADAQQAYFEALRNYPQNPDYNYNLAVSLDRMGKRKAALKYYEAAVSLTDAAHAGFDPALALTRIHAIASGSSQ
jgi:tetratricopeptide (TPR) repeat protein